MLDGGCAQGAFGCAGFVWDTGLLTCAQLPPSFSSDEVSAQIRYLNMQSPHPTHTLFTVIPDVSIETLLMNSYETVCSVSTLLLDLSNDLSGKHRDVALAIHQLSELSVLLVGKAADLHAPRC